MHIIKTPRQGLLFKTFEDDGRHRLVASTIHFFSFNNGTLATEVALWPFLAEQLGKEAIFDLGLPKPRGEGLVVGRCFTPGGRPAQSCVVEFSLGSINKKLYVLGDRYWEGPAGMRRISRAAPFTVMDLDWKNAFGGLDYPLNPLGKSHRPIIRNDGREVHPLPNVEDPDHLVASPDDRPGPAGFGPVDLTWPQRLSKAGTYDDRWLQECFPGLARDMDWTYFNAASPDQWLEGYFQGDEPFRLTNMHPDHPILEGRLPGFRSRVFINRKTAEDEIFQEIPMRVETVWFFPHVEKGVLIHRGTIDIRTDDAEDVTHLMAGYEKMSEPLLSPDHYRAEFVKRSDPENKLLFILKEEGLVPASEAVVPTRDDQATSLFSGREDLLGQNMRKRVEKAREKMKAMLERAGLPAADLLPPPPPPAPEINLNNLDMGEIRRMIDQAQTEARERQAQALEKAREMMRPLGVDFDQALAETRKMGGGKPGIPAEKLLADLRQAKMRLEAAGQDVSALEKTYGPGFSELEARLKVAQAQLDQAYKKFAHNFPETPMLSPDDSTRLREELVQRLGSHKDFSGQVLTGYDFHGLDLRGTVFKDAQLEDVDFSGADLSGADLSGAILVRSNLSRAILRRTKMVESNLGKCDLTRADFSEADLTGANLGEAALVETDLTGADLTKCELLKTKFHKTMFSQAKLPGALFLETDLEGLDFSQADLAQAIFIKPKLTGANFTRAKLVGTIFTEAAGRGVNFSAAEMTNARLVNGSDFSEANFNGATLATACLVGANLSGATFVQANLDQANCMQTNLDGADWTGAVARRSNLIKADLSGAKMIGVNLMEANLLKSRLVRTDLKLANLYGAELMKVVLGKTDFARANLKNTKLAKWSPE